MIISRDNSPERISDQDRLQVEARKGSVQADVYFAMSTLYGEWAYTWSAQGQAQTSSRINNAGSVIDHAFLRADIDAQTSQLASDRAVSDAQRRVTEAFDELSA